MTLSPSEPGSTGTQPVEPGALASSYHWQGPVILATAVAGVFVALLARGQVNGWWTVALIVIAVWAGYLALVRSRARALMAVDGPLLRTRRYRTVTTLDGRRVSAVREFVTAKGPCYLVYVRHEDGSTGKAQVPTAWLQGGHSTLFTWVLTWSPRADLDKGSRRTLDRLVSRGLVDPDLDPDA